MSYKVVEDYSMLFDDSKVAIIPVDSEFNPISKEGKIYTSIYKTGYRKCKQAFNLEIKHKKCYCCSVGKCKYVFFLINIEEDPSYLSKVTSLLRRCLNNNETVSILVDNLSSNCVNKLCGSLNYNLKVYHKVLAC